MRSATIGDPRPGSRARHAAPEPALAVEAAVAQRASEAVPVEHAYQYSIRLLCDSIEEAQQWVSALAFNINAVDGALLGASTLMNRFQNENEHTSSFTSMREGHAASRAASGASARFMHDAPQVTTGVSGRGRGGDGDVNGGRSTPSTEVERLAASKFERGIITEQEYLELVDLLLN